MRPSQCACSARALELFIKDFAGINLRTARPVSKPFLSQRRNFNYYPRRLQLETTNSLFERDNEAYQALRGLHDTYELDTDKLDSEPEFKGSSGVGDGKSESKSSGSTEHVNGREASLALGRLHETYELDSNKIISESSESQNGKPANVEEPTQHRKAKRRERKLKRIESGAYTPLKKAKNKGLVDGDGDGQSQIERVRSLQVGEGDGDVAQVDQADGEGQESAVVGEGLEESLGEELGMEEDLGKSVERAAAAAAEAAVEAKETGVPSEVETPGSETIRQWILEKAGQAEKAGSDPTASERRKAAMSKGEQTEKITTSQPEPKKKDLPSWRIQKEALERKFGKQGWQPSKRLSPDTLEGIRALHASDPKAYSTQTLAKHFEISPEGIRRILKSKWRPSADEAEDRRLRWEKRGAKKWKDMAEQGVRPPAKWRAQGIKTKEEMEARQRQRQQRKSKEKEVVWDDEETAPGDLLSGRIL